MISFSEVKIPPEPKITSDSILFLKGETFTINCTVEYQPDSVVNLFWKYPQNVAKVSSQSDEIIIHLIPQILNDNRKLYQNSCIYVMKLFLYINTVKVDDLTISRVQ